MTETPANNNTTIPPRTDGRKRLFTPKPPAFGAQTVPMWELPFKAWVRPVMAWGPLIITLAPVRLPPPVSVWIMPF